LINNIKLDDVENLIKSSSGSKSREVVVVELKKLYDPKYVIDEFIVLGNINYKDNKDLDQKMFDLSIELAKRLDMNLNRVLNYPDDDIINIEIEGSETKFIGEYSFLFYGFYELTQNTIFLLAFEDELKREGKYLIYKNLMFEDKFPYESIPDPKYYS
jgi:hypothetical protein